MQLPQAFLDRMKSQLGGEFPGFLEYYERPAFRGVRLNPLKCTEETLRASVPFEWEPSGFSPLSFYARYELGFGKLPAHHAGMFYSQEPSASSAVTALDPQPGEKILDLCAAPGGKATQIAGTLMGRGLLWANEPVRSRTGALLSNLERMGAVNSVVSCAYPERLCPGLQGFFDRVLVDAPCSGEGMFRREHRAVEEWSPQGVEACARRQMGILDQAALTVREGGVLVYSTCTFSYAENEGVVKEFLAGHPEFVAETIPAEFGREDMDGGLARRIYPMDGGEGHFVARFRRVGENLCRAGRYRGTLGGARAAQARELLDELFVNPGGIQEMAEAHRSVFLLPEELPQLEGLGVLRAGTELCQVKPKRLEPAHGIFMCHEGNACRNRMDLPVDGPEILAFLRGEEIDRPGAGYTAVCVNGVTVGFGKASEGRLKNRYPKGLRNLN